MHKNIQRRKFLALTAYSIGGVLTSRAAYSDNPRLVSLDDAHKGTLEIDLRIMNQFKQQPQELLDFYTAGRAALTSDKPEEEIAKVCEKFGHKTIGGPMLGDVTTTSIAVWIDLPEASLVLVAVTPTTGGSTLRFQSDSPSLKHSVKCAGLTPDTAYSYQVTDTKQNDLGSGRFTTPPSEITEKPFSIAFGADFHKAGQYCPDLMQQVIDRGNRAMFLIGDSAVDGRKDDYNMINVDYLLRNLSPPWQQLSANIPVSATWDDHDYWGNDTSGKFTKSKKPIDVDGLRSMWKSQWNNPERDKQRAGIYFQTRIGPIHYIALDSRSCRVNENRGKANCFLGDEQMAWLKQQIESSDAPCLIVSGGTMWTDYISGGKDSWGTWDKEGRETIFQWLDQKKDTRVILLSGDRHGARGFEIKRPNGGKFYEFEIGTLGGCPGPQPFGKDRSTQLFGQPSRSWAFGELTFQSKNGSPQITFQLINEQQKVLETVQLT